MGDVADILQIAPSRRTASPEPSSEEQSSKTHNASSAKKQGKGLSRELMDLIATDAEAAAAIAKLDMTTASGRKFTIDPSFKTRQWQWEGFKNSARADGFRLKHWMRKPRVVDDYPFSRFNKPVYIVSYTDEQYQSSLQDERWTKAETDTLVSLCRKFDCRWPVIVDRWPVDFPKKTLPEVKGRYFDIAKTLVTNYTEEQMLGEREVEPRLAHLTTQARNAIKDYNYNMSEDIEKRQLLDLHFRRTRSDEVEATQLIEQIQMIDAEVKKIRAEKKKKLDEHQKAEKKKRRSLQQATQINKANASSADVPQPAKKRRIEKNAPDVTIDQLDSVVASISPTVNSLVYKRSDYCLPLNLLYPSDTSTKSSLDQNISGAKSTSSTKMIDIVPPLGINQAKSLGSLLAGANLNHTVMPTSQVETELLAYRQDAIKFIVYEHALKKRKNDLRNLKQRIRKG